MSKRLQDKIKLTACMYLISGKIPHLKNRYFWNNTPKLYFKK